MLCGLVAAQGALGAPQPTRVLFVGNSLTYFNSLPSMVAAEAANGRPPARLEVEMLAAPGALIRQHLDAGQLGKVLAAGKFDVVVLQEVGGFPVCSNDYPGCQDSPAALDAAAELVRRSGARAILLATYLRRPGLQAYLSLASKDVAQRLKVDWFDWGQAMVDVGSRDETIAMTGPDLHPKPPGSWLAAIGLSQLITGAPPAAAPPAQVCAPDWSHAKPSISNTSLASRQSQPAVNCFDLADSTYSTLQQAVAHSLHRSAP